LHTSVLKQNCLYCLHAGEGFGSISKILIEIDFTWCWCYAPSVRSRIQIESL